MTPADTGWHWPEWAAELTGMALFMFAIVSANYWAARAPVLGELGRATVIAAVAGAARFGIAISVLGRKSGAHLNPAVTFGFWVQRVAGSSDAVGYLCAQTAGGLVGVAAARVWGMAVARPPVRWGLIHPSAGVSPTAAVAIEAGATFLQLVLVFGTLSSRWHRHAPAVASLGLAVSILTLLSVTGAGFNPVRGLCPDIAASAYPAIWIYLVAPMAGAAAAAGSARRLGRQPLTGKLRHDSRIECQLACGLTHRGAGRPPSEAPEPGHCSR
ncbi:MAG: aquaporin [Solirubrobacteraceae bacterium]